MTNVKEIGQAMVAPKQELSPAANMAGMTAAQQKMHRRSRSGCFTCRLRRKKCDEGKPACKSCRHLGLKCEYKRPLWWGNNEHRKNQKEAIKNTIKKTKVSEKTKDTPPRSPPGLSHSLPTSATYSDPTGCTRAVSEDSQCSFDFNQGVVAPPPPQLQQCHDPFDPYQPQVYTPQFESHMHYHPYPPPNAAYEVDIKTERQTYVDDVPTRRDSTRSTFSTFHPPTPHAGLSTVHEDAWIHEDIYETQNDMFGPATGGEEETALDFNFFDFPHGSAPRSNQALIQVDECDRPLLEHFIDNVLRLIFPILEANQHGSARSEVILPALESNKCYLHCCLSIAAIHLKSMQPPDAANEQLDADIVRHRYATISELCEALNRDTEHAQILEATLGMIFFQCSVGRPDDALPDIPWHQHFQAASSLVRKLQLPDAMLASQQQAIMHQHSAHHPAPSPPPFNMTLTSWIDILGSTMLGRAPLFANTYRDMHLSGSSSGLAELMGCEDRIMYLISEISCLEALKLASALDNTNLCSHITLLGQQIELTEPSLADEDHHPQHPHHHHHPQHKDPSGILDVICPATGAIRPRVLSRAMTALFRKAARIWLLSLIPNGRRGDPAMRVLQSQFVELLSRVPTGPGGFDRCIVWPLLMAGAQSTADGPLRAVVADRVEAMGGEAAADTGSFGRMRRLLVEVWERERLQGQEVVEGRVVWREVMKERGWDFLLL